MNNLDHLQPLRRLSSDDYSKLARPFTPVIFSILRTLKRVNPGDTYYEAYQGHAQQRGAEFFDHYHLAWMANSFGGCKRFLEIGTRTGLSMCQMLAGIQDLTGVYYVSFDLFNDGFISPNLVKRNLDALNIPHIEAGDNVTVPPNTALLHFIKGDSLQTVPDFAKNNTKPIRVGGKEVRFGPFDWVLVDGCHDKPVALQDLENVWGAVKEGGLLVFDDISETGCNLLDVWQEFMAKHPNEFHYITNLEGKGTGIGIRLSEDETFVTGKAWNQEQVEGMLSAAGDAINEAAAKYPRIGPHAPTFTADHEEDPTHPEQLVEEPLLNLRQAKRSMDIDAGMLDSEYPMLSAAYIELGRLLKRRRPSDG